MKNGEKNTRPEDETWGDEWPHDGFRESPGRNSIRQPPPLLYLSPLGERAGLGGEGGIPQVTPGTFTLTITDTSGSLTHATAVTITINVTCSGITNVIEPLLTAGCIDNSGIANALTSKLSAAQAAISAGDTKAAVNILSAFIHQVQAQSGKHIATSCSVGGETIDPTAELISEVTALIDSLK